MNTLVIYYSRTGITKNVAENISNSLNCDLEELIDTKNWSGPIGWLRAGKDSQIKKLSKLQPITKDLTTYDLVIIGTPVWSWTMSVTVRTFLKEKRDELKDVAYFCTCGSNYSTTFEDMESLSKKKTKSVLAITKSDIKQNKDDPKIKQFIKDLSK